MGCVALDLRPALGVRVRVRVRIRVTVTVFHAYVDHQSGEYSRHQRFKGKLREISTQRVDGQWGNLCIYGTSSKVYRGMVGCL